MSDIAQINATQMQAWRTFLFTQARVLNQLDRELTEATGLSLAWYDVLLQVHEAGESVRMGDLARSLLISPSAGTRLIDRMERQGLVERTPCADDRRVTFVKLSPAGQARLREAAPIHLEGIERHFSRYLTTSEADQLDSILGPILQAHS